MSDLASRKCVPCEGKIPPLDDATAKNYLAQLPGWEKSDQEIVRLFTFRNFYETMAFANAVAFIANQEDHHPDLEVSYKVCKVRFTTHAIQGLSENDFICAAKVSALLK